MSPVNYRLELPMQWRIHPVFHINLLTKYNETPLHGINYQCPPPELIDGEEEYEVEKVIASRRFGRGRKLQYLVKWKGYPDLDNQWVSKEDVFADEVIREFKHSNPDQEVHIRRVVDSPLPHLPSGLCPRTNTLLSVSPRTFGLAKSCRTSTTTLSLASPITTHSSESATTSPRRMDVNTPVSADTLAAPGTTNWTPRDAPTTSSSTSSEQPPPSPT